MMRGRITPEEARKIQWLVARDGVISTLASLGIRSRSVLYDAMRADATAMMSEVIRTRLDYMKLPAEASVPMSPTLLTRLFASV